MEGHGGEIHVDVGRVKTGDPCITVTRLGEAEKLVQGRSLRLIGVWDIVQEDGPRPCGSSVTLRSKNGYWRITA